MHFRFYPARPRSPVASTISCATSRMALLCLASLFVVFAITAPRSARGQAAWINEFHYDNEGSDSEEFVEIVVANVETYDIGAFSLYLVDGSDGTAYNRASGTAFARGDSTRMFTVFTWEPSSLQNGPDGIALVRHGRILDFVSYEGTFDGTEPPLDGLSSRGANAGETTATLAGRSVQLRGTGGHPRDFRWTGPLPASPGSVNANQTLHGVPLQLIPEPASAAPGDTVRLAFLVGSVDYPAEEIIGAGFQLRLDTALFSPIGLTAGPLFRSDTLTFRRLVPEDGAVAYSVTTTDPLQARSGSDTLAILELRIEEAKIMDTTVTFWPHDLIATQPSGRTVPLTAVPNELTITAAPTLEVAPTTLDFGAIDYTSTAVDSFAVKNTGGAPLEVTYITVQHAGLTIEPSSFTLTPGDSQYVTVSVRAAGDTAIVETLTIASNDPDTPSLDVLVQASLGAFVWPGDTDNNGRVDAFDVLPIGQHFGRTGTPRDSSTLAWQATPAVPWSPPAATYADATGDGLVSQNDIQPIGLNYGRQRAAGKSASSTATRNLRISRQPAGNIITVRLTVPEDRPLDKLLGFAFGLSYPSDYLEIIRVDHPLNSDQREVLAFERLNESTGTFEGGYTRKRAAGPVAGSATIASITFRATGPVPSGREIVLRKAAVSSAHERTILPYARLESRAAVDAAAPASFALRGSYPNPFNSSTTILVDLPEDAAVRVTVFDLLGRTVVDRPMERLTSGYGRAIRVDARQLTSGTYFYRVTASAAETTYRDIGTFTLLR